MHRYEVVDVFTNTPLQGNPVAVFTGAAGLSAEAMQGAAREMNLSESVFVVDGRSDPGGYDAHIRIFTPALELPFAGHPVLGTAFVLTAPMQLVTGTVKAPGGVTGSGEAIRARNPRSLSWVGTAAPAPR